MSSVLNAILSSSTLIATLAQTATNGLSLLGTMQAPVLPDFMVNNPLPQGFPWASLTAETTDAYKTSPKSGVIRSYDFTLARAFIAPDGVNKSTILINGKFPGPTIEANWGDTIQVTVHNKIEGPQEGTSLHWHGLTQKETPWYDGVPGDQQCPIAPGSSFTYEFKADLFGTSLWHAHYSSQYVAGAFGAMIIYGPKNAPYDIDIGPVLLTDHYHQEYFEIVKEIEAVATVPPKPPKVSDNNLINGKMNYDCSKVTTGAACTPNAGISKFRFKSGKTHRLRLINAGGEGIQKFTIDNHTMTVIANDFVPVKPYQTNVVTLGVAQRTDVLVTANGKPTDAVFMRSDIPEFPCSLPTQAHALAAIYYEKADTSKTPNSTATPYDTTICANDPLTKTVPLCPEPVNPVPAAIQTIEVTVGQNASGNNLWFVNGSSFRANYNHPLLLLANQGNTSYPNDPDWNVYNFGGADSIRLVVRNTFVAVHPMHLHGHNFQILAEGPGPWDGTITNPLNPQRRDVHLLQGGSPTNPSHMVIQWTANNPGVWPFHCHIAWHSSAGLYINVIERPDLITQAQIPLVMAQTCRDWSAYSGHNVVNQIDSGE